MSMGFSQGGIYAFRLGNITTSLFGSFFIAQSAGSDSCLDHGRPGRLHSETLDGRELRLQMFA